VGCDSCLNEFPKNEVVLGAVVVIVADGVGFVAVADEPKPNFGASVFDDVKLANVSGLFPFF
jgi:hypothetical protein